MRERVRLVDIHDRAIEEVHSSKLLLGEEFVENG